MAIETAIKIDIEVLNDGTVKQAAGLYKDLGEAVSETQLRAEELAKKYGILDSRTQKAIEVAGKYKNELEQLDFAIDAAKGGSDQLFRASQGLVGGFEAAAGSMALFGGESEELEAILLKVQGAMALSQGLKDLNEFAPAIKNVSQGFLGALKSVRTFSKGAKIALASTGIGALIVGVGLLIEYFSDLEDSVGDVDLKQQGLNETTEEYNKSVATTTKEVKDVGQAFELAKDGVISKEEALDKYNSTLGDVLGAANSLEEAEANYIAKTDAYIKATALRRQADVLLEKAAQAQADALTATADKQIASTENFILSGQKLMGAFIDDVSGGAFKQEQQAEKLQKNLGQARLRRLKKEKQEQANAYTNLAESLTKEAAEIEKTNNIKSKSNKSYRDKQKASNDKAAADAKAQRDKEERQEQELLKRQEELAKKRELLGEDEFKKREILAEREFNAMVEGFEKSDQAYKDAEAIRDATLNEINADREQKRKEEQQKRLDDYNKEVEEQVALQEYLAQVDEENKQKEIEREQAVQDVKNAIYDESVKLADAIIGLAGESSKVGKAIALAQIGADTARALSGALANANSPTPDNVATGGLAGIAKYIALATTILSNAKRAYNIIKAPAPTTGSPSTPSAPGVPQMAAPRLGGVINSENELTQMRKVYVVESDITSTQAKVSNTKKVSLVE